MLIGQYPGRKYGGETTRQEVEVGQQEQENSGKEEAHSSWVLSRHQKKQDMTCSAEKGTEPRG